jgi:hypothetical protein
MVQLLVDLGADINEVGGVWGTPLQAATYNGDDEDSQATVKFLLKMGANIHARGLLGNALQAAVALANTRVVQLLQDSGAHLDPPGPEWEALLVSIGEALAANDGEIFGARGRSDPRLIERLIDFRRRIETEAQSESESQRAF